MGDLTQIKQTEEDDEGRDEARLGHNRWCICGNCVAIATMKECVCVCHAIVEGCLQMHQERSDANTDVKTYIASHFALRLESTTKSDTMQHNIDFSSSNATKTLTN